MKKVTLSFLCQLGRLLTHSKLLWVTTIIDNTRGTHRHGDGTRDVITTTTRGVSTITSTMMFVIATFTITWRIVVFTLWSCTLTIVYWVRTKFHTKTSFVCMRLKVKRMATTTLTLTTTSTSTSTTRVFSRLIVLIVIVTMVMMIVITIMLLVMVWCSSSEHAIVWEWGIARKHLHFIICTIINIIDRAACIICFIWLITIIVATLQWTYV